MGTILKGVFIFFVVLFAVLVIAMLVGSLELSFGAGSRKPKEKQQQEKKE